jgi:hypothetical protein
VPTAPFAIGRPRAGTVGVVGDRARNLRAAPGARAPGSGGMRRRRRGRGRRRPAVEHVTEGLGCESRPPWGCAAGTLEAVETASQTRARLTRGGCESWRPLLRGRPCSPGRGSTGHGGLHDALRSARATWLR